METKARFIDFFKITLLPNQSVTAGKPTLTSSQPWEPQIPDALETTKK